MKEVESTSRESRIMHEQKKAEVVAHYLPAY